MPNERKWTKAEIAYVVANYRTTGWKTISRALGLKSECPLYTLRKRLGLERTTEENSAIVNRQRFHSGQTSWNKGRKGLHCSPATEFRAGHLPHNTKSDGAITVREDKRGNKYKYIRVALGKWQAYHIWVYEQQYGPVPKGVNIRFKNGDTLDCRLENLMPVTRKEHCILNKNPEKTAMGLKKAWAESRMLTDKFVARTLTYNDPAMRKELLNHPEILELKRAELKLKRKINETRRNIKGND